MNNDIKTYVIGLLETCQNRKQKIALLHYELKHPAYTSETEMISIMALGHGAGNGSGYQAGHISDKTVYIALNYQSKADELNAGLKKEIVEQLVDLEQKQKRLEYYVSLLEKRQTTVIRSLYFQGLSQDEVAKELEIVPRTVRRIRDEAVDKLVELYSFTKELAK